MADNTWMPNTDEGSTAYNERLRRRMLMARIEAGLGGHMQQLRDRLLELGYDKDWGVDKLNALQSGQYDKSKQRDIRPPEIRVLAEACGVSPAFFHTDFSALEEPDLRDEIAALHERLADLAIDVERHYAELKELRDEGRHKEPPGDDPR